MKNRPRSKFIFDRLNIVAAAATVGFPELLEVGEKYRVLSFPGSEFFNYNPQQLRAFTLFLVTARSSVNVGLIGLHQL